MSVTKIYQPEEYDPRPNSLKYHFGYEWIEQSDLEVWEIIDYQGQEYRYLVPIQDYTVEELTNRPRYSVKEGAFIIMNRPHSEGTVKVRLERNTLIDQTYDFPKWGSYNGRMVGQAFDKATLIFQEIAQRKCATTTTPITQEVEWTAYDNFPAQVLKSSVDKLYTIAQEIKDGSDDCTENPEGA